MHTKIIQLTSGKGPEECERVVYLVFEEIQKQAKAQGIVLELIEAIVGKQRKTYLSVLFYARGENASFFFNEWKGTVQWIGESPFRKNHKRKNWFVGISVYEPIVVSGWKETDIVFQSTRASGPGGQHVNKVESAVRATHLPTGISVLASTERSQQLNKKLAIDRLYKHVLAKQIEAQTVQQKRQWLEHHDLERGGAVKSFRATMHV